MHATLMYTHTHTHSRISGQWDWKQVFSLKEKALKEDLKELTAAEWQTEAGSWFQITGAW